MQNNDTVIVSGRFYTSDLTLDWTVYEDGVYLTTGVMNIPSSGSYYSFSWTKSSIASVANWTVQFMGGGVNVTFYGFNFIVKGETYEGGAIFQEGDTINNGAGDAAVVDQAFWLFAAVIMVVFMTPILIGVGFGLKMFRDWWNRTKKRSPTVKQHDVDIMR